MAPKASRSASAAAAVALAAASTLSSSLLPTSRATNCEIGAAPVRPTEIFSLAPAASAIAPPAASQVGKSTRHRCLPGGMSLRLSGVRPISMPSKTTIAPGGLESTFSQALGAARTFSRILFTVAVNSGLVASPWNGRLGVSDTAFHISLAPPASSPVR